MPFFISSKINLALLSTEILLERGSLWSCERQINHTWKVKWVTRWHGMKSMVSSQSRACVPVLIWMWAFGYFIYSFWALISSLSIFFVRIRDNIGKGSYSHRHLTGSPRAGVINGRVDQLCVHTIVIGEICMGMHVMKCTWA